MPDILSFRGKYEFLSNFYPSSISINRKSYPTVEHYYQAMKAMNEEDHERIRNTGTPGQAKKLGNSIQMREDWEAIKDGVMLAGLQLKFKVGTPLYHKLLETKPCRLYEGNTWGDRYWGTDPSGKSGKNMLGILLMRIRDFDSEWD